MTKPSFSISALASSIAMAAGISFALGGVAMAQSGLSAETAVSPGFGSFMGEVSIAELAKEPFLAPAWRPPVEMPRRRLPDGTLTSEPSLSTLQTLPENIDVVGAGVANPAFVSTRGFVGIHSKDNATLNGFETEPPDQGLAVHDNVVAEINNLVLEFFNGNTGASLATPVALSKFFMTAAGNSLTDTQVFYDPSTTRWYLTMIESNSKGTDDIDVAISRTSNPLGGYFIYHINAFSNTLSGCGGVNCFPDYPKAGYDANGFYVSVDLFNNASGAFVAAATFAMPKSKLITGAVFSYLRLTYPSDFVVQPSVPAPGQPFITAGNGTEYLMDVQGFNSIRLWAISNTNNIVSNITSLSGHAVNVTTEGIGTNTVPSTEPDVIGPVCKAKGVTSAPTLDGGYHAFQSTIQLAANRLAGVLDFGTKDANGLARDDLAWIVLTPSVSASGIPSATIFKQGYLVAPTGYSVSYGAFGLNNTGAGALGMTITNKVSNVSGGFPSAAFVQFTGSALTGSITVTGPGITSDDGFSGCANKGPGGVGRWGDYGAATIDSTTGFFYTANENISGAPGSFSNWGTFITQLH